VYVWSVCVECMCEVLYVWIVCVECVCMFVRKRQRVSGVKEVTLKVEQK
jgi:hypothetical protein